MKYRNFILLSLCCLLSACASTAKTVPHTKTYVLDSDQLSPYSNANSREIAIQLNSVRVANYIDRKALITRISTQQVTVARYHVWGEKLPALIHRALKDELNRSGSNALFVDRCQSCVSVSVTVDHFYPTDKGKVVFAGSYTIHQNNKANTTVPFLYEDNLAEDGYQESVYRLRGLLIRLASNLVTILEV